MKTRTSVVGRIAHGLAALGKVLLAFLTFMVALVSGLLLHLDLPSARRVAVKELNRLLAPSFQGTVAVDSVAGIGVFGVRGVTLHVQDPGGERLLYAQGVRLAISPLRIARSFLLGKGPIQIDVGVASVDYVDACLDADSHGDLKLAHAFDPKTPSPADEAPGRGLRLSFPTVTLGHSWLHGVWPGLPTIDGEVDAMKGALRVAPDVTRIDVERLRALTRALPMGANVEGELEAHVELPADAAKDSDYAAIFRGAIGGVVTTANASMVGKKVDAVLDAPEATPERVHARMSDAPVYQPVSLHAEAHGELADVHATGYVTAGSGKVDLDAHASLGDDIKVAARIEATHVDVRAFMPRGPHSSAGAIVDLHGGKPKGAPLMAAFAIDVPVGRYGENVIPHATFHGEATYNADASWGPVGAGGHLAGVVDEVGAPTSMDLDARPSGGGEEVAFVVHSEVANLRAVRRIGDQGTGRVRVDAKGAVAFAAVPRVDAEARVQVDGFKRDKDGVRSADIKVLASGALMNPKLKTLVVADGVDASGYLFDHVRVAGSGLLDEQEVILFVHGDRGSPSFEGRGDIDTKRGLAIHAARVWVSRGKASMALAVGEVKVGGGSIAVDDATLDGLGSLAHANVHMTPGGRIVVHASADDLDLKQLGYVLKMEDSIQQGRVSFDVDLDAERSGARGHVKMRAEHVVVSSIDGAEADVDLNMEGRQIQGSLRASLKDVARVDFHTDGLHLGGHGPLEVAAWRKAWGKVVFSAQGDMKRLAAMVPADRLPVSEVSGGFQLSGAMGRDSETDDTPDVTFSAATRGLVVGTKSGPVEHSGKTEIIAPPRSRVYSVDPQLDVRIDGSTGFAEISARVVDKRGAIAGLDAKSADVPYRQLMESLDGAGELLARIPFALTVVLPSRPLQDLPPWISLPGASGEFGGTLTVTGSAISPKVSALMRGHAIRVSGMTPGAHLDADIALAYDGQGGDVDVHVRSTQQEVLAVSAHADAKIEGVFLGGGSVDAWTASVKGRMKEFPLAAFAPLSDRQVEGHISGDFSVDDLHKDARAKLALSIDDLGVGAASFKSGKVDVTLDGKGLDASARLDQKDGFAEVKAKASMTWGDRVTPAVDPQGATTATVQAKHFRAVALLPLLQSQLSELDGNIDADASFSVTGAAKPTMQGNVSWSDGVLQVNALGEEFHAVRAKLSLAPDGALKLTDASFSGPSGRLTASGSAKLNGLTLASAEGAIKIDKRDALPLDLSGASMGQIYGDISIRASESTDQKLMTVTVDIPTLHVDLPLTSVASVEDLGRAKDEHFGYFTSPDRFIVVALGPDTAPRKPKVDEAAAVTELKVHLGKDIEIRKGTTMKVVLDGDPSVRIADETAVRGQIRLKSGILTVQGKKFEIEKGTVSFVGTDPSDPEVSVTAGWTAEDGTRVYADFIGPLKTGKVTLRSEPGRPKNEIVALILFGTADGSQSTPYASPSEDNATRVGTTAGGFATEGLSKGLDQLTGMEISTKIDTSNSANPRPEVEVQIAKDISVQLAFVLGTPPPGTNPDTAYASIDWRFLRNWSLETTFGNLGSTIADVIWQYRY